MQLMSNSHTANRVYRVPIPTFTRPCHGLRPSYQLQPYDQQTVSGFHALEINGNGAQSIIYWIIGLFTLCVVAGGSESGAETGKT